MESVNYDDGVEEINGFELKRSLDFMVERGLSMLDDWQKRNIVFTDLMAAMCATSGGPGLTTVDSKSIGWAADKTRLNERLKNYPGAVVLHLTDIDLTIIVDARGGTDRDELVENQEYEMTKDEFLDEIRKRL